MGYLLENCTFCELTQEVISRSMPFSCKKEHDIETFFQSEFKDYKQQLLGKSYCFVQETGSKCNIVCAFTVANSSIKVDGLPNKKRSKLNRRIPNAKRHTQYPAVLVGQLAVFDNFKGLNIGHELMNFIKSWFIDPLNKTGCRYIIVDAVNKPSVKSYYEKNGFNYIFTSDEEEMRYMSKSVSEENIFKRIYENLFISKNDQQIFRKTRLMYYDLILLSAK